VALVLDEWVAPGFTQNAEVMNYSKAYAAKIGLDASTSQDISQRVQTMFGRYKGIWSEMVTKMQGTKGYPVKTSFTLGLGGPQCKNANAQQAQSSDNGSDNSGGPGGLAGSMAGKLGGLFHKKKDDSDSAAAPAAPPATTVPLPPGDVALMTISSQLVSVSTNSAGADAFTVPADFKRQESKTSN